MGSSPKTGLPRSSQIPRHWDSAETGSTSTGPPSVSTKRKPLAAALVSLCSVTVGGRGGVAVAVASGRWRTGGTEAKKLGRKRRLTDDGVVDLPAPSGQAHRDRGGDLLAGCPAQGSTK